MARLRNKAFSSQRQPIPNQQHGLHLRDDRVTGPISFLNPTQAVFEQAPNKGETADVNEHLSGETAQGSTSNAQLQWRSRDNRKGRHTLVVYDDDGAHPPPTSTFSAIAKGMLRMLTSFPYWDVSFLVAFFYTIGCAAFILDAFFYWLPLVSPNTEFPHETTTAGGVTAFVGATLFQIGAILLVVEATNENQTGCFGWALEQRLSHHEEEDSSGKTMKYTFNPDSCTHHHHNTHSLVKQPKSAAPQGRKWEWWPTWSELRTHYFHEIGFLGSFTLFVGSTVFYVSAILDLPGVFDHLSQGVLWGIYWLTYLVGGVLFIVSSVLYMLEVQSNWYTPAPRLLGWHVGLWNLIGSVGWTLSAAFGYCSASGCAYQSNLTLLWASVAFLTGSLILWYEALDKYPVERRKAKDKM